MEITGYQCDRWRDTAAVLIPHGPPQSLQDTVNSLFLSGSACDFSFPGPAPCPSCGESCIQDSSVSVWSLLPWSARNAPDRLFFASFRLDIYGDAGVPPVPSPILMIGVEFGLVAVVYSIPNPFVTQLRSRGRWLKYVCILGTHDKHYIGRKEPGKRSHLLLILFGIAYKRVALRRRSARTICGDGGSAGGFAVGVFLGG